MHFMRAKTTGHADTLTDHQRDIREQRIRNPYTRKQQVQRLSWWIGEFLLFRCSLRPMYSWRRWVLRMYGAKLGDHVCIQRSARIEAPWKLEMGRYSSIGEGAWIYNIGKVEIGDFVVISQRAFLCTGTHDYELPQRPQVTKPIVIQSGAWICADAFLGPGVTVGEDAVVGARACVFRDVNDCEVVGGNPARVIKMRKPVNGGASRT